MKRLFHLLLVLLVSTVAFAQYDFDEAYFYPEAMQDDLDMFVKVVKEVHPCPWRYTSEREFDALVVDTRRKLAATRSIYDYMAAVQPVLAALGDAHTRMELPIEFAQYAEQHEPLIPIKAQPEGDRLYLREELKGFRTLPGQTEILSINGLETKEILNKMRANVTVDGESSSYADFMIAQRFPLIFHRSVLRAPVYTITYLDANEVSQKAELKAMTGEEINRAGKSLAKLTGSLQWTTESTNNGKFVWLRVPTLSSVDIEEEGIRPDRILKQTQKLLKENNSEVLVVDVRGTSGMEIHLAEMIYRTFALNPFRALSNIHYRTDKVPYGIEPEGFPLDQMSELALRSVADGEGYSINERDELLKMISPEKDAFQGKVFILSDGGTTEAAVSLATMVRRDGRGKMIGSETGGNSTAFCASRSFTFTTRRTGLRFSIPLVSYELDRGSNPESALGIKPDMSIYQGSRGKDEHDAAIERDLRMFMGEWQKD